MDILFITHYTNLYGANKSLLTLLKGLVGIGHTCTVVSPGRGPFTEELEKIKVPIIIARHKWWVTEEERFPEGTLKTCKFYLREVYRLFYWNIKALIQIKKQVSMKSIDLVYTNSSVSFVGILAAVLFRKPHIWHLREFATLHYNYRPIFGEFVFKSIIRASSFKICISQAIQCHYLRNPHNSAIIYNGVLSQKAILENIKGEKQTLINFAIVGVLHKSKNQAEAIRALALASKAKNNIQLLVAGEGEEKSFLVKLAQDLGVADKVIFLGYVEDVVSLLRKSYALLMCSRNEGMGRVTAEAMCLGVPVIGFKGGGTVELVDHEENGLLYENGEIELAEHMVKLVENKSYRNRLSSMAKEKSLQNFTIENYVNSVEKLVSMVGKKVS
jgi:glycosyltransferase involved in cell wall biosynthesis